LACKGIQGAIGLVTIIGLLLASGTFLIQPDFEILVDEIPTEGNQTLDQITTGLFSDNFVTSEFIRNSEKDVYVLYENQLNDDDKFVLSRIYHTDTTGKSESILIWNDGWIQAKDVIIKIEGENTNKIIGEDCPEIENKNQILKEINKNYRIKLDRMSQEIFCGFTINSVGDDGITRIIVTAKDSPATIWTESSQTKQDNTERILFILILTIGIGAFASYFSGYLLGILSKRVESQKLTDKNDN